VPLTSRPAPLRLAALAVVTAAVVAPLAGAPAASAEPATVTVPVTLVPLADAGYMATIEVSLSGSAPVTVMIDTGSAGLVLSESVFDPTGLTSYDVSHSQDYDAGSVPGEFYSASIDLLDGTGASLQTVNAPVLVGDCAPATPCEWLRPGIVGVLGVGQGVSMFASTAIAGNHHWGSPFTQLPVPLGSGITLDFDSATLTGTMELGAPTAVAGSTTLQAAADSGTYANQLAAYGRPVSSCWIIGGVTSCDTPTVFDTGAPHAAIVTTEFEALLGGVAQLADGTEVRFATPPSGGTAAEPFASFAVSSPYFEVLDKAGSEPTGAENNSGSGVFLDRTVALDFAHGTVIVGPAADVPDAAPTALAATDADSQSLFVQWTKPQPMAGLPVVAHRVTVVADDDEEDAQTVDVPASATSARIPGLRAGTAYRVTVAVVGVNGAGPASETLVARTAFASVADEERAVAEGRMLPATGGEAPLGATVWGAGMLLVGALVVVRYSRRKATSGGARADG
jgi:LPXTG-motif cell wall-anchored protein